MNKIKQSQNKQNNNNIDIHDHTVQNEQREYNAYIGGLAPSEWAAISQIKTQKKENKTVRPFFARSAPPLGDGMRKKDTEIPPKRTSV
jgi:hypothetical protein